MNVTVSGDDGHRQVRMLLAQTANQVQSASVGEPHVGQTQVQRLCLQGLVGALQVLGAHRLHVHA